MGPESLPHKNIRGLSIPCSTRAAIRTASLLWFADLRCHLFLFVHPGFDMDPDRPDQSEQLSAHGRYDLRFVLPCCQQFSVARVQAMLGLPGDRFDFFAQSTWRFNRYPPNQGRN